MFEHHDKRYVHCQNKVALAYVIVQHLCDPAESASAEYESCHSTVSRADMLCRCTSQLRTSELLLLPKSQGANLMAVCRQMNPTIDLLAPAHGKAEVADCANNTQVMQTQVSMHTVHNAHLHASMCHS